MDIYTDARPVPGEKFFSMFHSLLTLRTSPLKCCLTFVGYPGWVTTSCHSERPINGRSLPRDFSGALDFSNVNFGTFPRSIGIETCAIRWMISEYFFLYL